jgi:EAL domain-containing protein (putative c-di-GMP-specific phosphodiesterase class I)
MLRNLQKVCLYDRSSVTYSLQCTRRAYATGEKETCQHRHWKSSCQDGRFVPNVNVSLVARHASEYGMTREDALRLDCPDCEALPEKIASSGRLHLWLASRHSVKKLRYYLSHDRRWTYEDTEDERVLICVDEGEWGSLLADLSGLFSSSELDDAKALCKVGFDEPSLGDFPNVRSLRQLIALAKSDWLLPTLLEQRLITVFQPIVWADDPTNIYAQECLLRAEAADGRIVSAETILDAAREARLLAQTDLAARHTAIREVVRHGVESHLFINLALTYLYDPATCLRSTVKALDRARIPHSKVVFEVTETDETADVYPLKALTDYRRNNDFRVALDDVGSGYSSLNLIHRLRPDFIKLDMELIRGVEHDPYKAAIAQKIIELAHSLGISTIAEGVETSGEMRWVQAHGATFAQGWFIAKPANPPVRDSSTLIGLQN